MADDITLKIQEEQAQLDELLKQEKLTLDAINQLNTERDGVLASINRLKGELIDEQKLFDETLAQKAEIEKSIAEKVGEIESLNTQIFDKQNDLLQKKKDIDVTVFDRQSLLDATKRDNDALLEEGRKEVDSIVAKKESIQKEIDSLNVLVQQATATANAASEQCATITANLKTLNGDYASLQVKYADLQKRYDDLQKNVVNITDDIASKKAQIASLNTDIASKNSTVDDLNKQIADLQAELKKNDIKNNDFLLQRAAVQAQAQEFDQRFTFLKQKYQDLNEPW